MNNFMPDRAIELMLAVDSAADEKEASIAFEAAHVYLLNHGKGFRDIYRAEQAANVVDLQDLGRITLLEQRNIELEKSFVASQKELKTQKSRATTLAADMFKLRFKTMLISAFVGASAVGSAWVYNSGKFLLSVRSELVDHYETKERGMVNQHQEAVTTYNQKKDKLDGEYAVRTKQLNENSARSLEESRKSLQKSFNRDLEIARVSFRSKLEETQPFRAGEGQFGYVSTNHDEFSVIYSSSPSQGHDQHGTVVGQVQKGSCLIITGVSEKNPAWMAVTQVISGKQIYGYIETRNLSVGDIGPVVECVSRKAILAP